MKFLIFLLLWCVLLVFCWPVALLVLLIFPVVWLVCLPFRIGYYLIEGLLTLLRGILRLPGRLLGGGSR